MAQVLLAVSQQPKELALAVNNLQNKIILKQKCDSGVFLLINCVFSCKERGLEEVS